LFNANGTLRARPVIKSAPATAATGQTISVTTGSPVSGFSLVRYGEATHSVDNDQRRIRLSIVSSSGDTYKLAIPRDPGIALPGPYMLFALDSRGTPSVAKTISIASDSIWVITNTLNQALYADRSTTPEVRGSAAGLYVAARRQLQVIHPGDISPRDLEHSPLPSAFTPRLSDLR
jgi:hypothetical protein